MEKEGLVHAVKFPQKKKFKIDTFVSDRHKQISSGPGRICHQPSIATTFCIWQNVQLRL